jgi:hypothetical protein
MGAEMSRNCKLPENFDDNKQRCFVSWQSMRDQKCPAPSSGECTLGEKIITKAFVWLKEYFDEHSKYEHKKWNVLELFAGSENVQVCFYVLILINM